MSTGMLAARDTPAQAVSELQGVVRDAEGRPVAGATVTTKGFLTDNLRATIVAESGEDGRFVLELGRKVPLRALRVYAYKPGLAPGLWRHYPARRGEAEAPVEVVLKPAGPFEGVVKDERGGPVAGARVWATAMQGMESTESGMGPLAETFEDYVRDTPLGPIFLATTDAAGRFRFPAAPLPAALSLDVTAPGKGRYRSSGTHRPVADWYIRGTPEAPATIVLRPEGRIAGRLVTRLPGVDLGGIRVEALGSAGSSGQWPRAVTGPDGAFELLGLAEGRLGVYLADQPADPGWAYIAAAEVVVEAGKTIEVVIELIRGVEVEGRVVLASADPDVARVPADPVAGVSIGMIGPERPRNGATALFVRSAQDGSFRFRLPPGPAEFYVGDSFYSGRGVKSDIPEAGGPVRLPPIVVVPEVNGR